MEKDELPALFGEQAIVCLLQQLLSALLRRGPRPRRRRVGRLGGGWEVGSRTVHNGQDFALREGLPLKDPP